MEITPDEQIGSDFEWFAVDRNGAIAVFFSGGNKLPDLIAASKENLKLLSSWFLEYMVANFQDDPEQSRLGAKIPTLSEIQRLIVAHHFGLHIFDNQDPGGWGTKVYVRYATPERAIYLDSLPHEIRKILEMATFDCDFDQENEIDVERFLKYS
jgi:hypothetical protein